MGTRGRLAPLRNTQGFRDFVLDQLEPIAGLTPRAMFGGIGLYADGIFFGILAADVLYLKVDDTNRSEYVAAGMKPFQPYPGRPMTMRYYEVPVDVLEDGPALVGWARKAIAVAASDQETASRRRAPRRSRARRRDN